MAHYIKYQTADGGFVLVEVEGEAPAAAQGGVVKVSRVGDAIQDTVQEVQVKLEDAVDVVQRGARIIIDKVKGLSDPPDEIEVTFGLKAAGELGNFAIAKASAEANYTVKMMWQREKKGEKDKDAQ
jgi:hypothetical protein